MSLIKYFKNNPKLPSLVGDFIYKKNIGEGGNANVLLFQKNGVEFALKFLKTSSASQLSRFQDEFFCVSQLGGHANITKPYHFDSIVIDDERYYFMVMKHYTNTLAGLKSICNVSDFEKSEKGIKLFIALVKGIKYLHDNKILHRDIKPQNIFYCDENSTYVLGDLGIAKFSSDKFSREAATKKSDRMANYLYSAPEQVDSKGTVSEPADIFSLGQVMQWYLTGSAIRGTDRQTFSTSDSPDELRALDKVIDKCLKNDPNERYQSISDLILNYNEFFEQPKPKDHWTQIRVFDDVIRRSFTKIKRLLHTKDCIEIERFLRRFSEICDLNKFWFMSVDGGNNQLEQLVKIDDGSWLMSRDKEIRIEQLIVYRNNAAIQKDFFVIVTSAQTPFSTVDNKGNKIVRNIPDEVSEDWAYCYNDQYIEVDEVENGYYDTGSKEIEVDCRFQYRTRELQKFAYLIAPEGTPVAIINDWKPITNLLQEIVNKDELEQESLKLYLESTISHYSKDITYYM